VNPIIKSAIAKYDDIKLNIVYEGSENDCLAAELLFRPRDKIGWNIAPGGALPPEKPALGKRWKIKDTSKYRKPKSEIHRARISQGQMGNKRGSLNDEWKKAVSIGVSKTKWWNNGTINVRAIERPDGFVSGRLYNWMNKKTTLKKGNKVAV
jgi:hypothetical protein